MPDYQSAYRAGYSCETALVKLMSDLLWNMEDQKVTALMAIDLSAAFDMVDHDILLDVLQKNFVLDGPVKSWFDSYLRPRKCRVCIGTSYSSDRSLDFSVPQGSCAGPVLYLAYASTMKDVVDNGTDLHGYADDHVLKRPFKAGVGNSEVDNIQSLEINATIIQEWMDANRLKMNASKTEFVIFGYRSQLAKCVSNKINVNGVDVPRTCKIKYLGAILDENLSMKEHIKVKCQKAMYGLHRLRNVRKCLTREATEVLALGTVISHLDYSNALFIGLPKIDLETCKVSKTKQQDLF